MLALALDSTTRAGSVALVEDDRVVEEREGDPGRTHAERLPRDLEAVLEAHGRVRTRRASPHAAFRRG